MSEFSRGVLMAGTKKKQRDEADQGAPGGRAPRIIADRYAVLEEIGRGGVATVYRAHDERLDRSVALKRLHYHGSQEKVILPAFEHEFQVLDQLDHPRIVRVFDYGHDGTAPYYTMELLEGQSLKRRLPISIVELAKVLRDVASSLALLHARRYVHRDVTPRNVWCESDGGAKLLDFGAMVPMGSAPSLIGTPPFVAPELLHRQPLDGRADIFALGALAYRALTGRHAYVARSLHDLWDVWQRGSPPRPATLANVPGAIDELVMAMINLDRDGRPATASEVMERLCAATDIPVDSDARAARAYLLSPPLLGRERVHRRIRQNLLKATAGSGRTLLLSGPQGIGASRLLRELGRDAKQVGATVLSADRQAAEGGDVDLLRQLCEDAVEQLPREALELAAPHAGVLSHLSPAVRSSLGEPELAELPAHKPALTLVTHLHRWLEKVAGQWPLLIAVDGLHLCDAVAVSLLHRLARSCHDRQMLLVVTRDSDAPARFNGAEDQLLERPDEARQFIELTPLDIEDVTRLTDALFWGADNQRGVATWLHRVSGGVPGTCLALAQHLLDVGLARYEMGRWHLPAYPQEHALPTDLSGLIAGRVARLSTTARELASVLALAYDDTQAEHEPTHNVTVAELSRVLEAPLEAIHRALSELHAAEVVPATEGRHRIAHRALAEQLRGDLDPGRARAFHAALYDVLVAHSSEGRLALRHLQLAGEHARVIELLSAGGGALSDLGAMRLSLAADLLCTAVDYARTHDVPREQEAMLHERLGFVASVFDWSLKRYMKEELERLLAETGLDRREEFVEAGGPVQVHAACMSAATARRTPDDPRTLSSEQAMLRLPACAAALGQVAARAQDLETTREATALFEWMRELEHGVLNADSARETMECLEGRELSLSMMDLVERFMNHPQLSPVYRLAAAGVQLHRAGVRFAAQGNARVFDVASLLEGAVPGIWLAAHLYWLGHAFRCEGAMAKRWQQPAIAVSPDDLWRRRAHLMVEARLHALTYNTLALKGVLGEIDVLAEQFPGWQPWRYWAWGEYLLLRGSLEDADAALSAAIERSGPGQHAAWGHAHPAHVVLLTRMGDHQRAVTAGREGLAHCAEQKLDAMTRFDHQLALAEALAAIDRHEEASGMLDDAEGLLESEAFGGVHQGRLCEARVQAALDRSDWQAAETHLAPLSRIFMQSEIPQLTARYVRLAGDVRSGEARSTSRNLRERWSPDRAGPALQAQTAQLLSDCEDRAARGSRVLALLLEASGADAGLLYLANSGVLSLCAQIGDMEASSMALAEAQRHADASSAVTTAETRPSGRSTRSTRPSSSDPVGSMTDTHALVLRAGVRVTAVALLRWRGESRSSRLTAVSELASAVGDALAEDSAPPIFR